MTVSGGGRRRFKQIRLLQTAVRSSLTHRTRARPCARRRGCPPGSRANPPARGLAAPGKLPRQQWEGVTEEEWGGRRAGGPGQATQARPGPCIRMDTAAPSRQQQNAINTQHLRRGGEPQGPGKWGFGGFQPLQAQMSPWKVTGTVPAGSPQTHSTSPPTPPPPTPAKWPQRRNGTERWE